MLQKCSIEKVLEVFFDSPTKDHELLEISRKIHLAHTSVKNILNRLINKKILIKTVEKKGKRKFPKFKANHELGEFRILKKLNNIRKIYDSSLIKKLEEELMPNSIILFGSYSRGEDIESSDIDLFIESKEKEIDLKKYEKKLSRKVSLTFSDDLNKLSNELKENIINGIPLEGYIEIK